MVVFLQSILNYFTMIKVVTLFFLFIGLSAFSQVSLKEYTLGDFHAHEMKNESVAKIYGSVITAILDDGRLYQIYYKSLFESLNGEFVFSPLNEKDAEDFKVAVEDNFNIRLRKLSQTHYDNEKIYTDSKNSVKYWLRIIDYRSDPKSPTDFYVELKIIDLKLEKIHKKEANSDF